MGGLLLQFAFRGRLGQRRELLLLGAEVSVGMQVPLPSVGLQASLPSYQWLLLCGRLRQRRELLLLGAGVSVGVEASLPSVGAQASHPPCQWLPPSVSCFSVSC